MISSTNNNPMLAPTQSVQLNALNADALKYLGTQVGKVIEAKVVNVSEVLLDSTSTLAKSQQKNDSQTNATRADSARTGVAADKATDPGPVRQYQIVLEVENQKINVKSPLAPRLGQLLQLQVINYQTLALLAASARSEAVANTASPRLSPAGATPSQSPDASPKQTLPQTRPVEILQHALRSSLPRQLPRETLAQSYQQVMRSVPLSAGTSTSDTSLPSRMTTHNLPITPPTGTTPAAVIKPESLVTQPVIANTTQTPDAKPTVIATSQSGAASTTAKQLQSPGLPSNITQAITRLNHAIPQLSDIVSPDGVKNAILNSGLFFESRLAQLITRQSTPQASNTQLNTAQITSGQTRSEATINPPPNSTSREPQINQAAKTEQLLTRDLKHLTASLAQSIKSTLSGTAANKAATNSHSADKLSAAQRELLQNSAALALLWQLDNAQIKSRLPAQDKDNNDAIMQLLRLALGQLARTQNHQLQAAGSQLASSNDASTTQTLTTELPFWYQGAVHLLDIRIDQEQAAKNAAEKPQAWNLRLRFDLDELGELVALATLQGKSMAAVFWASEKVLMHKLHAKLEQLHHNLVELGIDVKQLHCQHGEPDNSAAEQPVNLLNTQLLQEKS